MLKMVFESLTLSEAFRECYLPSNFCWVLPKKSSLSFLLSLTSDGDVILYEINAAHPPAKSMIELSRTQDEECGDETDHLGYVCLHLSMH
jgi:hypothetical protein